MSQHSQIQEDLAAYVADRLAGEARDSVDVHLEGCAECRNIVACGEGIAAGLNTQGSSDPHPSPVVLYSASQNGSRVGDPSLARHLESCETCSLEVETWARWNERQRFTSQKV